MQNNFLVVERSIRFIVILFFFFILSSCNGQSDEKHALGSPVINKKTIDVGGPFENSEFIYQGIPKQISATDTSPGWNQKGQKLLLTGTVYHQDGKTPAPDVLLYYYQTNTEGRYLHDPDENRSMQPNDLGQTHGSIRGWVKSDEKGKYFIYTVRPGVYPTNDEPAHIHITVKEPNDLKEYYIDDFVFDDDKLLTSSKRLKMENRAGSGILRTVKKAGLEIGERNLVLGLNIPNYPSENKNEMNSGRNIGEDVISFMPYHAWGPDKGTKTCPVCKYGWYHGILYFVGNNPDWQQIKQWLVFLESESVKREKYLKAYFIYGNAKNYSKTARERELEKTGKELNLKKVALTYVPSFNDEVSEINLNKINPETDNTIILYKRNMIIDKFINLEANAENFELVRQRLESSRNEYFDLPKPGNTH